RIMQKVLVPLADGVEEMEAVIVIDMLRRAQWHVLAVGLKAGTVTAARGTRLIPDEVWDRIDLAQFDVIVIPGGARGVENLRHDKRVVAAVRAHAEQGKLTAAVCAAGCRRARGAARDVSSRCDFRVHIGAARG
ncbi:MAG: DJ-1/PfpI family protein, partial [Kiritimatiellaeota bacterium]|nr:DJ-1/PfpI family protein [Kiritimatiellota bacterium]